MQFSEVRICSSHHLSPGTTISSTASGCSQPCVQLSETNRLFNREDAAIISSQWSLMSSVISLVVVRFRTRGCTRPHNAGRKILKNPAKIRILTIGLMFALSPSAGLILLRRRGRLAVLPVSPDQERPIQASDHVPRPIRRAPHRDASLPVPVVIARRRNLTFIRSVRPPRPVRPSPF